MKMSQEKFGNSKFLLVFVGWNGHRSVQGHSSAQVQFSSEWSRFSIETNRQEVAFSAAYREYLGDHFEASRVV